jgi:photosystem II stability/assembly factor-like uncharacterized protein
MNWTEVQPAGVADQSWRSIAANETGSKLLAVVFNGSVYYSTDGGVSWSYVTASIGSKAWFCCAVSGNGSVLVICARYEISGEGRIYKSTNGGTSWTAITPSTEVDKKWMSIALDYTGQNMIACALNDFVYVSHDGGTSWIICNPMGG